MGNSIKYTTGSESNSLAKGNFRIGTGDVGKGASSVTGFYKATEPPSGGYRIYLYNDGLSGDIAYYTATNDSELISFTNNLVGTSFTTAQECLVYYSTQTDKVCFNREYEPIVTDGLILNVDAGFTPSYPRSGITWYDVSTNTNNGTLVNGPSFSSGDGGSIVFDGVDDFISGSDVPFRFANTFTLDAIVYFNGANINGVIIGKRNGSPFNQYSISISSGNPYTGGVGKVATFFGRADGGGPDILLNYTLPSAGIYNIVASINANSQTLYVNGIARATSSINISSNTFNILGRDLLIGAARDNAGTGIIGPFPGNIYTTKIYNRTLSADEVLQNYNAQKARFGL
jgi:hypothetical protein